MSGWIVVRLEEREKIEALKDRLEELFPSSVEIDVIPGSFEIEVRGDLDMPDSEAVDKILDAKDLICS